MNENKESTIFTNILLTSDLKGYVEQPNYYFTAATEEVNKALDNLMLTQGYRRFAWKDLSTTVNTKPKFKAEGLGTNITGKVTTLANKLLPNATVNLISPRAKLAKVTNTDANGNFSFDGMFLTDSVKLTIAARSKASDKVRLMLDTIPTLKVNKNPNLGDVSTNIAQTLKTYIDNGKKLDDIYEKAGLLDKVHRLREVRIRARKKDIGQPNYGIQIRDVSVDHSYVIPEADKCANLGNCLQGKLPG
ncbi:carboxypeptidase-like regulatory domain-containing protein [Mucilaginibacter antarcticus]|uniref:carboxypeptidase-like regulatory domain-containing protein n=1 Tax=Mucilaginibacter antarcticus TaxID=1855725 RepID=UPI00363C1F7F